MSSPDTGIPPLRNKLEALAALMRLDRPIGSFLLLWPTLWALWLAAEGLPSIKLLLIFTAGTFVMRAAGCVINDIADRGFDGRVERTRHRPLPRNEVRPVEALILFALLMLVALALVLQTNQQTLLLAFMGAGLAAFYPFTKRFFPAPQLFLGAAFSWGIPMAFTASGAGLPPGCWVLFAAGCCWTLAYDSFYAMADRDDDLHLGLHSTAILFGKRDLLAIGVLQLATLALLFIAGPVFDLGHLYYGGLFAAAQSFFQQLLVARKRDPDKCFRAFRLNNRVGVAVFTGIVLDDLVGPWWY